MTPSTSRTNRPARGTVVVHPDRRDDPPLDHERATLCSIGQMIAELRGDRFGGEYDPAARYEGPVYFVPIATVVGWTAARALGIECADDLFGGVVPHAWVATKVITHGLVDPRAAAPEGWREGFARRVRSAVLPGYAAFTVEDARTAGERLLTDGRVRLKEPNASGSRGQSVVDTGTALEAALAEADPADVARHGLVLERDLADVETYSVGQVVVGRHVATYYGTQRSTVDNHGREAYGGSDLVVVRGGWDALLALDLPDAARLAVAQARAYDEATSEYPELVASRRNYDVARGTDCRGARRSGVLEQSWRFGGASGPEVAALLAFLADPECRVVKASSVERFAHEVTPDGALVHFHGVDPTRGPMTKYTTVESHEGAR